MDLRAGLVIAAMCAALLLSADATAQSATSQVTFGGTIDTYIGRQQLAGQASAATVSPSGLTTSFWSISAVEDLGGGFKAQAFLSAFMQPDTGSSGRYPGDAFLSRRASVGIAGAFGEISVGRMASPFFLTMVGFDPFAGGSLGPIFQHTYPGGQPLAAPMQVGDSSISNMINYQTPALHGIKLNASYGLSEQAGQGDNDRLGASLTYTNGPLAVAMAMERNKAQLDPGETRQDDAMLAAAYDFERGKGFLQIARHKKNSMDIEYWTSMVGATVPIGAGNLLVAWGRTRYEAAALRKNRSSTTVVYDYVLSRRTDIYLGLENDRITGASVGNSLFAGMRLRF
ncbi:porin [Massilia sp. METH4]|uniref:porin n=1 Tax=Massilia sp. METH4 TaxID=3123041 RepID=UPI0030D590A2